MPPTHSLLLMMKSMETSRLLVLLHAFMITSLPMFESRRWLNSHSDFPLVGFQKIFFLWDLIFFSSCVYFLVDYLLEGRFNFRFFDNLGRRLLLCVVARCRYLLLNPILSNSEWKIWEMDIGKGNYWFWGSQNFLNTFQTFNRHSKVIAFYTIQWA